MLSPSATSRSSEATTSDPTEGQRDPGAGYSDVEEHSEDEISASVWYSAASHISPSAGTLSPNPEADQNTTEEGGQPVPAPSRVRPRHGNRHHLDVSSRLKPPVRQYDASNIVQHIGLLRIVNDKGSTIPQYIWWDHFSPEDLIRQRAGNYTADWRRTTINRDEALVVSFLPSPEPHTIACLNSRGGLKSLAIRFNHYPDRESHTLYGCTNNHHITAPAPSRQGFTFKVWNILPDWTLQASLSSFQNGSGSNSGFKTTEVHVDISGDIIRFVKPDTLLEQDKERGNYVHPFVKARIVFEPLS